jgi:hypothetical protein
MNMSTRTAAALLGLALLIASLPDTTDAPSRTVTASAR